MSAPALDVAVIGGGILGCALAAFLAERGASVGLWERDAVAAAASGRNSGVLQHPMDEALAGLFEESLRHYRDVEGFELPEQAAGVLVLAEDEPTIEAAVRGLECRFPELRPERLGGPALVRVEPALAPDLAACRLATGYPVPPAAATRAFAARARLAGAELHEGRAAAVWRREGRAAGVEVDDRERVAAGAVVIAAGPWTPRVADPAGRWRPVAPVWGVVAELELSDPPRHVLEESGVDSILAAEPPPADFSLVTANGVSSLGSTFLRDEPDPAAHVDALRARGARFLPALHDSSVRSVRACARPQSADGRPLLGALPGLERLFVAGGHGPWGLTLGPASARMVADEVLAGPAAPPAFAAGRFGPLG